MQISSMLSAREYAIQIGLGGRRKPETLMMSDAQANSALPPSDDISPVLALSSGIITDMNQDRRRATATQ